MIKCKYCDGDVHLRTKGNNIGIYCSNCGKWQKWASKDEIRLIKNEKENNKSDGSTEYFISRINELINNVEKEVEREESIKPMSQTDAVRKTSYCLAMIRCCESLKDILTKGEE